MIDKEASKKTRMQRYIKYAELRDSKKLRDCDVALKCGINPTTLSDWKSGKSEPKVEKLFLIAKSLKISLNKFYEVIQ